MCTYDIYVCVNIDHIYLNDEMIKQSSLDGGIICEFLFLCALLYFQSFLHYACITSITRKKNFFSEKKIPSQTCDDVLSTNMRFLE